MAWKVDGIIGGYFPSQPTKGWDTNEIRFVDGTGKQWDVTHVYFTTGVGDTPKLVWHRYWEEDHYEPYGGEEVSAVFTVDAVTCTWTVTIYKNYGTEEQEDITSSFAEWTVYLWKQEFTIQDDFLLPLGEKTYKDTEYLKDKKITNNIAGISSWGENPMHGCKYIADAAYIKSKDGSHVINRSGDRPAVFNMPSYESDLPLQLDENNGNIWFVIEPHSDVTVTRINAPMLKTAKTETADRIVKVIDANGLGIFNGWKGNTEPTAVPTTHGNESYNYVPTDISDFSSATHDGKFILKSGHKYYIKYTHAYTGQRFYYRNNVVENQVGYSTNVPDIYTWYDTTKFNFKPDLTSEDALLKMDATEDESYDVATFTGTSGSIGYSGNVYRCKQKVNYGGSTDDVLEIAKSDDPSKIYLYTGVTVWGDDGYVNGQCYSSKSKLEFIETSSMNDALLAETDTYIKWTGSSISGWIKQNTLYKKLATTDKWIGEFSSLPDYTTLSVGDVFIGNSWSDSHYSGLGGYALYEVTAVSESVVTVSSSAANTYFKETSPGSVLKNETSNVKSCFETLTHADMRNVTVNTDRRYEFEITR